MTSSPGQLRSLIAIGVAIVGHLAAFPWCCSAKSLVPDKHADCCAVDEPCCEDTEASRLAGDAPDDCPICLDRCICCAIPVPPPPPVPAQSGESLTLHFSAVFGLSHAGVFDRTEVPVTHGDMAEALHPNRHGRRLAHNCSWRL